MLKKLKALINTGAWDFPERIARKTRIVNMMTACAIFFPFLYSIFYFAIGELLPAVLNWIVLFLYGATFLLNHLQKKELAKLWLLSVYTIHLFILTKIIFSSATGFHYYYMAVPPLSFLIYDHNQVFERVLACVIPVIFLVICETINVSSPLVLLSATTNQYIHLSSVLFLFTGLFVIIYLFSNSIMQNEKELERSIRELEQAASEIKTLKGLIPICSTCKKIRDDKGYWNHLEAHLQKHSYATFSHGICPGCSDELYGNEDWYKEIKNKTMDEK